MSYYYDDSEAGREKEREAICDWLEKRYEDLKARREAMHYVPGTSDDEDIFELYMQIHEADCIRRLILAKEHLK